MEEKQAASTGVTVVGSDSPTDYHIAPRSDPTTTTNAATAVNAAVNSDGGSTVVSPVLVGSQEVKKKRGRPRKYALDGSLAAAALSAKPISVAVPSAVIDFTAEKRPKLKASASQVIKPHQPKFYAENLGEWVSCSVGANFTPHVITVHTGEDVTMKIISFSQEGPRAICILSANGAISRVTVRQANSSGGTMTYEGRFEILSLSGSFRPSDDGGIRSRAGGMSISLATPNGQVVGGSVAGLLVAASPVQIVVGSFLWGNQHEQKPRKPKSDYMNHVTTSAAPFSCVGLQEKYGSQGHQASGAAYSTFHGETRNGSADHHDTYHEG